MINCFLSHSSQDKSTYVQLVADRLPKGWRTYDQDTFESGMNTLEEILRTLGDSSLFVLFISDAALESKWVQKEILHATTLLNEGSIKKVFPIIIDPNIKHDDKRIPEWLRDNYNLRSVTRPSIAVKRIHQRLREIAWASHPRLKEREEIFVGRNAQTAIFEERFNNVMQAPPISVVCSGLPMIGRKTYLKQSLIKAGVTRQSYEAMSISLSAEESIEDLIVKIYDLGVSEEIDISDLLTKNISQKIDLAERLCTDIASHNEIVLIEDNGCIFSHNRTAADWFIHLLDRLRPLNTTIFAIASRFKYFTLKENIFVSELEELSPNDRMGLFKRYARFENLSLTTEDYVFFQDLLFGYPDQVFYAVALIKELGLPALKKRTELLVEFNSERADKLISLYAPQQEQKEFLYLLSEFDFISYDLLESLINIDSFHKLLDTFLCSSICETLGANREYIRLNDSIRDYMRRSRMSLPKEVSVKIQKHVEAFVQSHEKSDIDASDYLFSVRKALSSGIAIDPKYLIPSHFLKAMKDLYDNTRKYSEIVSLADRVLQSKTYIDTAIIKEIRYFLCLSLARLKDKRFLTEVQEVNGEDHNFLLGFYYRLIGKTDNAITQQLKAIQNPRIASRARRELVQLYIGIEDYEAAISLAERTYTDRPENPYHIQSYLTCLINLENWHEHAQLIEKLLNDLDRAKSRLDKAEEMHLNALAQYQAYCKRDYTKSLETIDLSIEKFPDNLYPVLTKINILFRQRSSPEIIKEAITILESKLQDSKQFKDMLDRINSKFKQYAS